MDIEKIEEIKEAFKGIKFFFLCSGRGHSATIVTYRPISAIYDWIKEKNLDLDVRELSFKDLFPEESGGWGPYYCVELHNNYNNLESLAEDLIIGVLSGIMETELDGMFEDKK